MRASTSRLMRTQSLMPRAWTVFSPTAPSSVTSFSTPSFGSVNNLSTVWMLVFWSGQAISCVTSPFPLYCMGDFGCPTRSIFPEAMTFSLGMSYNLNLNEVDPTLAIKTFMLCILFSEMLRHILRASKPAGKEKGTDVNPCPCPTKGRNVLFRRVVRSLLRFVRGVFGVVAGLLGGLIDLLAHFLCRALLLAANNNSQGECHARDQKQIQCFLHFQFLC